MGLVNRQNILILGVFFVVALGASATQRPSDKKDLDATEHKLRLVKALLRGEKEIFEDAREKHDKGEQQEASQRVKARKMYAAENITAVAATSDEEEEDQVSVDSESFFDSYESSSNITAKMEEIMRGPAAPPVPLKKQKEDNTSKFILYSGLAVLAVVIVLAGVWGYNRRRGQQKKAAELAASTPPPPPVPMPATPVLNYQPKAARRNSSANAMAMAQVEMAQAAAGLTVPPSTPCTTVVQSSAPETPNDAETDGATTEFSELTDAPLCQGDREDDISSSRSSDADRTGLYLSNQSVRSARSDATLSNIRVPSTPQTAS